MADLERELAAEREAHAATRERAEEAEALIAETRRQAEEWVAESKLFMDETVADARHQADSERAARLAVEEELSEVKSELMHERELRLELERGPREAAPEPEAEVELDPAQAAPEARPAGCSVCQRPDEGLSADELVGEGWAAEGDELLCPSCREAGWQLAPGMNAPPFRRYSDRRAGGQPELGEEPPRTASSQTSER